MKRYFYVYIVVNMCSEITHRLSISVAVIVY